MSTGKKNVPEIRFGGFSDPWEQRKLGDAVQITMGQSPDGNTYSDVPSNYILIQGNADLQNGWVSPRVWTSQMTKRVDAGDLIMSVRAPAGAMGKTAYDAVIGRGVAAIKGNEFIYQLLVKMDADGFWKTLSCGSTFESLNSDNIKNAEVKIPTTAEQIKIGGYFQQLDNLITLHQRKYESLVVVKKSMLEKMFPREGEDVPEIRFAGFTDPWEQRKLGDITDFVTGKSFSQDLSADGTYVVMDMGTVSQEGNRIETKLTLVNRDVLSENDLVMPKDDIGGGLIIGRTVHIPANNQYVLGDHVYRLRFKNENGLFLHYQINSDSIRKQIMPLVTGSAQLGLNSKNIQGVYVNIPSVDEQVKIGEYFSNLDNLITLHQRKCEVLKNLKSALLSKMFVGTTE